MSAKGPVGGVRHGAGGAKARRTGPGGRRPAVSRGRPLTRSGSLRPAGRPAGTLTAVLLAATGGLILFSSCSDPVGPAWQDLRTNLERWDSRQVADYSFEYRLNCFCGGPGARAVMIVVRNGEVDAVSVIDDGSPGFDVGEYPTVDELFDRLGEALEREPHSVRASYDPHLGHPTSVFVDFEPDVADEEWGFEISGLTPLEGGADGISRVADG